jgi:hypothetical protein
LERERFEALSCDTPCAFSNPSIEQRSMSRLCFCDLGFWRGGVLCFAVACRARAWIGWWLQEKRCGGEVEGEKLLFDLPPLDLLQLLHNTWRAEVVPCDGGCSGQGEGSVLWRGRGGLYFARERGKGARGWGLQMSFMGREGTLSSNQRARTFRPQCTSAQCAKAILYSQEDFRGRTMLC